MPLWQIEQREAGDPAYGPLGWVAIGAVQAPNAGAALHEFCIAQHFYAHTINGDQLVVHGVGYFRASLRADDPELGHFVIQRQDPIGPGDRHISWSDIATVDAADAAAALARYLDSLGEVNLGGVFGSVANIIGIGSVRAVPADRADELRVTEAPRTDEPLP